MKLTYYGTSAGGGIPEIFCHCRVCEYARANRGKDIRTRSQAVIDGRLSIEYPVDTFLHSTYCGLDMRKINHVLITHAHYDHFLTQDILSRPEGTTEPVRFYASEKSGAPFKRAIEAGEEAYRTGKRKRTCNFKVEMNFLEFYKPTQILDYTVIPLRARHADNIDGMIFIISSGGKNILWAHDTGVFRTEAIEYIRDSGIVFDFISLDCTLERGNPITPAHMDLNQCKQMLDVLSANGNTREGTVTAISHIGHLVKRTHEELEREARELGMCVAYDGMTIEI